jgi:hypothetical protein
VLIRAKMRWQNNGADLPVVGSFKSYTVSTLSVVRLLVRWGVLGWLSVAGLLVDADLFTVLRRLRSVLLGRLLGRLLELLTLADLLSRLLKLLTLVDMLLSMLSMLMILLLLMLLLERRLGTTQALFFVDADLFGDVRVVLLRSVHGSRERFVDFFVTFPSV